MRFRIGHRIASSVPESKGKSGESTIACNGKEGPSAHCILCLLVYDEGKIAKNNQKQCMLMVKVIKCSGCTQFTYLSCGTKHAYLTSFIFVFKTRLGNFVSEEMDASLPSQYLESKEKSRESIMVYNGRNICIKLA